MNTLSRALCFIALISSLLSFGLWHNLSPWLRGDNDWRWNYYQPEIDGYFITACAIFLVYLICALLLWRRGSIRQTSYFVFIASLLLPIGGQFLNNIDPINELMFRTVNPASGGYLTVAMDADTVGQFLRSFPFNAPDWVPHPQRHPPGVILIFMALERIYEALPAAKNSIAGLMHPWRCLHWPMIYRSDAQFAAASGAFLIMLLNAITVVPFLKLARRFYTNQAIKPLLLLLPILPAHTLMMGSWDAAFVLFSVTGFWLVDLALRRDVLWIWGIAGLVFSAGSFMTHALFVAVAGAGIYVLITLWDESATLFKRWKRIFITGLTFCAGLGSLWLAYWIFFGVSYLDVYQANTTPHFAMASNYWLRLLVNPYDFAMFLGFAVTGLTLIALARALKAWSRSGQLARADQLVLALWLTLILLTISGLSRAEVGRVWIFLMPLFVLMVGRAQISSFRHWTVLLTLVVAQTVVMQATFKQSHELPRVYRVPSDANDIAMTVGDQIELVAWQINDQSHEAGSKLEMNLFWRSNSRPIDDYTRFVHLYSEDSGVVAQSDGLPADGKYQTGCWRNHEVVTDAVNFIIDGDVAAGQYQLLVGMYAPDNPSVRLETDSNNAIPGTIELSREIEVTRSD